MIIQSLYDKLTSLRLSGVREGLQAQVGNPKYAELSFEERLAFLIDGELTRRSQRRLERRLKEARFRNHASLSDIDFSPSRQLDRTLIFSLAQCDWICQYLNVIISGSTGVGKSYLASALGRCACEKGFTVRYTRTSRLLNEIEKSNCDGSWGKMLDSLARIKLLILDDWLRDPLSSSQVRNLLEIFDDRWQKGSTILISQLPIKNWHEHLPDPTLADAILDRIIHNAYKIEMKGESRRKLLAKGRQ